MSANEANPADDSRHNGLPALRMRNARQAVWIALCVCLVSSGALRAADAPASGPESPASEKPLASAESDRAGPVDDPLDDDRLWNATVASVPGDKTLKFLDPTADRAFHEHHNRLIIDSESLATGWVQMRQCHDGLGPIANGAIVFHRENSRNLEIESSVRIGDLRVDAHRVLVRDVEPDGSICITGELRALERTDNGYVLRNGPFQRRFLDGYFPMCVTLDIDWGSLPLAYRGIEPDDPGLKLHLRPTGVTIIATFEGVLRTRVQLESSSSR